MYGKNEKGRLVLVIVINYLVLSFEFGAINAPLYKLNLMILGTIFLQEIKLEKNCLINYFVPGVYCNLLFNLFRLGAVNHQCIVDS